MKKAFTLSEALVTLAIIGVLAAILIPVVNNVKPDKDKITYKKALYTMSNAVSNVMDEVEYGFSGNLANYWAGHPGDFCQRLADALNTTGKVDCSSTSSYEHPNFITTDGIRYWGLEPGAEEWDTNGNIIIHADRNLSTAELQRIQAKREKTGMDNTGMIIRVDSEGKVAVPTTGAEYEADLVNYGLDMQEGSVNSK